MEVAEQALQQLINFIEGSAPHVWEVMVRQQLISGAISTTFGVLLLLSGYLLVRWGMKGYRLVEPKTDRWGEDKSDRDAWAAAAFIGGVLVFMGVLVTTLVLPKLLNPEYAAIMDLLRALPWN